MSGPMTTLKQLLTRLVSTCALAIVGAASWLICTVYIAWVGAGE